ncbi:MAG: DUF2178 domain-containing protein [Caldilineaceae bacterium]
MNTHRFRQVRAAALIFMAAVVVVSIWLDMLLLAGAGVLTGLLFLVLVRSQTEISVDEREQTIRDKAASATYGIFAATIGISAVLLLLFSRRGYLYLEAVGLVFAYLTLFLIALYAVSYQYFNRKYGGGRREE